MLLQFIYTVLSIYISGSVELYRLVYFFVLKIIIIIIKRISRYGNENMVSPPNSPTVSNTNSDFIGDLYPLDRTVFLIFGYGSLLWRQGFAFTAEYNTYVKGFERVFYQGSRDHRGTLEDPGRVVTLLPASSESRVDGKAFQLPTDPEAVSDILRSLDARETGYERYEVELYDMERSKEEGRDVPLDVYTHPNAPASEMTDATGTPKKVVVLLYIATAENSEYRGPASMEEMALNILRCRGFSGANKEYLYFLAEALEQMQASDDHVFELYQTAKKLDALGTEQETHLPDLITTAK